MSVIRKILMPLLVIPLGVFIYVFTHPDWQWESPGLESLFAVIGIPILIINFMAWFYPEIIKAYFPVKEDWGKSSKPVTLAIAISALVAFTCVSVGMMSSVTNDSARPTFKPSVLQPATRQTFPRSDQTYSDHADSGESDIVPVPRLLPQMNVPPEPSPQDSKTEIIPEQTPQIPVSGGALTSSPTLLATQTKVASASIRPTNTASLSTPCTPANLEYLNTVSQSVQEADPENVVAAGWMVQSKTAANLWFVAAKIQSDTDTTLPGVWALLVDSGGNYDIYAINNVAMDLSFADWGEDSEPVLTMQSDGAQTAYDCAARAK